MRLKILTLILTLLTFNTFAQDNCPQQSSEDQILEAAKKLNIQKQLLRLYQKGILKKNKQGEVVFSDDGESLIDELKKRGAFEEIQTNGDHICA